MKPFVLLALLAGLVACTRPAADTEALAPEAPSRAAPAEAASAATDPAPVTADTSGWRAYFEGPWTGADGSPPDEQGCGQYMVVQFDSTAVMCIESNQIFARVRWRLDEAAGRADLLLVEPDDLGVGGGSLPWSDMDTDAPLATLEPELGEGRYAEFVWHGFHTRDGTLVGDHGSWRAGAYGATGEAGFTSE